MSKIYSKQIVALSMIAAVMAGPFMNSINTTAATKKVTSVTVTTPPAGALCMKVGTTCTLKTKVLPNNASNKKLSFTSSKKKILSVNAKGKVKAKAVGSANVVVSAKDGSKKKSIIKVKVVKKFTKAKKVSLNTTATTLYINGTTAQKSVSLTSKVTPAKATLKKVSYVTSDKSVATVSTKGVVTAVSTGTAKITAYAGDGRGAKATCIITVSKLGDNATNPPSPTAKPVVTPKPTDDGSTKKVTHNLTTEVTGSTRLSIASGNATPQSFSVDAKASNVLSGISGSTITLGFYAHNVAPTFELSDLVLTTSSGTTDISLTKKNVSVKDGTASIKNGVATFSTTHKYNGMLVVTCKLPSGVSATDISAINFNVSNSAALSMRLYAGSTSVKATTATELTGATTTITDSVTGTSAIK